MPDVEEMLYSALEDFRVDILVGTGPGARTHSIPLPRFTGIGATTRQGLVSAPLRGRLRLVPPPAPLPGRVFAPDRQPRAAAPNRPHRSRPRRGDPPPLPRDPAHRQ